MSLNWILSYRVGLLHYVGDASKIKQNPELYCLPLQHGCTEQNSIWTNSGHKINLIRFPITPQKHFFSPKVPYLHKQSSSTSHLPGLRQRSCNCHTCPYKGRRAPPKPAYKGSAPYLDASPHKWGLSAALVLNTHQPLYHCLWNS